MKKRKLSQAHPHQPKNSVWQKKGFYFQKITTGKNKQRRS